jgi:hypothetical protein
VTLSIEDALKPQPFPGTSACSRLRPCSCSGPEYEAGYAPHAEPGGAHFIAGEDRWEEVADYALSWAAEHIGIVGG